MTNEMSSGRLVVLDRAGRAGKSFPLRSGQCSLGRAAACDIRVLLPTVCPHHATVATHHNQTVIRNVSDGETLVNGRAVSVAALQHNDVITIGDRQLRWEYDNPELKRPLTAEPALYRAPRSARLPRRVTAAAADGRDPFHRTLQVHHRASMPGNAGGKQVAIVQPQRRDTSDQIDTTLRSAPSSPRSPPQRPRAPRHEAPDSPSDAETRQDDRRASRISPKSLSLHNTTKATLWIESRKASPRKSTAVATPPARPSRRAAVSAKKVTPLRMTVLRKAQSARKINVTKIEAPLKIDHMKQAALMLMTGHSPRARLSGAQPSRGVTLQPHRGSGPRRSTGRKSARGSRGKSVSVLEITDSDTRDSTITIQSNKTSDQSKASALGSPLLPSPKKSALKDPSAKRSVRKTESIKFDFSNLDNHQDESDVVVLSDRRSRQSDSIASQESLSEDDLTLHYSEASCVKSPSPRRSIHSRSSRMLQQVGSPLKESRETEHRTLTPESPRARKSLRGSVILQKALDASDVNGSRYSRRTTKTLSDQSWDSTVESAFRTRTLSPRASNQNLESYSIVDLVSMDSNESGRSSKSSKSASVYDSVGSTRSSSIMFGTPQASSGRKTRSTIDPNLLTSSTPYGNRTRATRSNSNPNISIRKISPDKSTRSSASRRSKSLTTPENSEETQKHISINSTRISRVSRSRSRINDSDLQFVTMGEETGDNDSPRTSRRGSKANKSLTKSSPSPRKLSPLKSPSSKKASPVKSPSPKKDSSIKSPSPKNASSRNRNSSRSNYTLEVSQDEGTITPENRQSPQEVSTPVLSIQNLLNSSQSSFSSQKSPKKTRASVNAKRKTIGVLRSGRKGGNSPLSKSFTISARKSLRSLRLSKESEEMNNSAQENEEIITPKSSLKLVQEDVKNKHSTARKPQSKRSIIDHLNESDIVKQLFNSPVKRKLSQSMTEFSRKKLFDDDEVVVRRPTRNTFAFTARTPDSSLSSQSPTFTPEDFVSPLSTPSHSPNLFGIKRLYAKKTPENDLRNVKGVKRLLRTPRARKSVRNDLTNVSGLKTVFAKSPKNRLSDVRVKEVFTKSPRNDLRRVSGVKSLFQSNQKAKTPDLTDVRGVRNLYTRKSAANDLRNVSGVKRILQHRSPRNDLTDVRGVKQMFRQEKQAEYHDVSGIEELFNESNPTPRNAEALFDQLIGKPPIKAVYSKSFVAKRPPKQIRGRAARSLRTSIDLITNKPEEWLEQELHKYLPKDKHIDQSKANVSRELQKLTTDTVEGNEPIRTSRVRSSTIMQSLTEAASGQRSASQVYSAPTLPIKKRSFVEAWLEKSTNDSKVNKSNNLPIKKRAVVHSTPMKGRYNVTMNASELGRVSPIAFDRTHNSTHATNRSMQRTKSSPKSKDKRTTKIVEVSIENVKPQRSPKSKGRQTRRKPIEIQTSKEQPSPKGRRTTRNKVDKEIVATERVSRAKNKENQVTEPKASPKTKGRNTKNATQEVNPKPKSPKGKVSTAAGAQKSRRTRNNTDKQESKVEVIKSPKPKRGNKAKSEKKDAPAEVKSPAKTRGSRAKPQSPAKATSRLRHKTENTEMSNTRKGRKSLVITKKAPVLSPKPTAKATRKGNQQTKEVNASPKKAASTRKRKADLTLEKPNSPKRTRAKLVVSKPSPKLKPSKPTRGATDSNSKKESPKESQAETRRGRRNAEVTVVEPKKRQKTARSAKTETPKPATSESKPSPPAKRGRKTVNKSESEPPVKKGRNTRNISKEVQKPSPKKTRTQKNVSQESVKPTKSTRSTKTEDTAIELAQRGRKRKTTDDHAAVPSKVSKMELPKTTRGRKITEPTVPEAKGKKSSVKENKSKKQEKAEVSTKQEIKVVTTRSKRQTGADAEQKVQTKVQKSTKAVKGTAAEKPQSPEKKSTRGKKVIVSPVVTTRKQKNKAIASPEKVTKNTRSRRR